MLSSSILGTGERVSLLAVQGKTNSRTQIQDATIFSEIENPHCTRYSELVWVVHKFIYQHYSHKQVSSKDSQQQVLLPLNLKN
jgi:hypothetical protein